MSLPGVEPRFFLLHILLQSQPGTAWEPISQHLLHIFPQLSWLLQPLKPWQRPVLKAEALWGCVCPGLRIWYKPLSSVLVASPAQTMTLCVAPTVRSLYFAARASVLVFEGVEVSYVRSENPLATRSFPIPATAFVG